MVVMIPATAVSPAIPTVVIDAVTAPPTLHVAGGQ
jgi:hypothetical protein